MDERIPFVDGDFNFWHLYDTGKWEPGTRAIIQVLLQPGDEFLDIGAWIGPVSLWALERGAIVTAYEPDPVAYEQLVKNTRGKGVIHCAHAAVTATGGECVITNDRFFGDSMSKVTSGDALKQVDANSTDFVFVNSVTPAEALGAAPWGLVKVDIEGGERELMPILAPLCVKRRIPLLVSWHEPWWPDCPSLEERQSWFAGSRTVGEWGKFDSLLSLPY